MRRTIVVVSTQYLHSMSLGQLFGQFVVINAFAIKMVFQYVVNIGTIDEDRNLIPHTNNLHKKTDVSGETPVRITG